MVDFNTEATVSTPATDVMRILILEARHNLLESIESFQRRKADGQELPVSIMRSRLWRLFQEIEATLKRHLKKEEFEALETSVMDFENEDVKEIMLTANTILSVLDAVQLTRIDLKKKLGGNIKERNKAQGWRS